MARPRKRKAAEIPSSATAADKKQDVSKTAKKNKGEDTKTASKTRGNQASSSNVSRLTRSTSKTNAGITSADSSSAGTAIHQKKNAPKNSAKGAKPASQKPKKFVNEDEQSQADVSVSISSGKPKAKSKAKKEDDVGESENEANADGNQYWLMKAEPESRIEKGKDVKFSIDDLKAASGPEPWDGVRSLEARNNMRAMTKGDLAFFYHSNCKVPGIVGIMEIVEEHSVDESAFDQDHPYYDEKSSRESPKWHLVHVAFKQKFPAMITLKELQKFSKEGGILENMQTLRRSRLSVSKVSTKEWEFILSLVDIEDEALTTASQPEGLNDAKPNGLPHAVLETNDTKPTLTEVETAGMAAEGRKEIAKSNIEIESLTDLPNSIVAA